MAGITPIYYSATAYPNIQSGQAVFITSLTTAGSLSFNESNKANGSVLVNRETNQIQSIATNLMAINGANMILADGNVAVFDKDYSSDVNADDAIKLLNGGENFGLSRSTSTLAVEAKKALLSADTLFYNLSNVKQQAYRLMFVPENLYTPGLSAELVDKFQNTRTPVSLTDTNYVNINFTADILSRTSDRFMLVFKMLTAPLPVTIVSITATGNADKSNSIHWTVEQQINIEKYEVERSADGRNFIALLSATPEGSNNGSTMQYSKNDMNPLVGDNFYRIKAISIGGQVQYSAIVKVFAQKQISNISVYPNPVAGKIAQVQFINQDKGVYDLKVVNGQGQVIYSGTSVVNSNYFIQLIPLGQSAPAGVYQLQITTITGNKINQALLVQ